MASRDRYARVIYGEDRDRRDRDDGRWDRDDDRRDRGRAIPRDGRYPYPERYPYPDRYPYPQGRSPYPDRYPSERGGYGYGTVPFDNGYKDGYDKGREDARANDAYDPVRHSRYRSADRGYDRRYGTQEDYKDIYREGFRAGYDDGYRDSGAYGPDGRGSRSRLPWPFKELSAAFKSVKTGNLYLAAFARRSPVPAGLRRAHAWSVSASSGTLAMRTRGNTETAAKVARPN